MVDWPAPTQLSTGGPACCDSDRRQRRHRRILVATVDWQVQQRLQLRCRAALQTRPQQRQAAMEASLMIRVRYCRHRWCRKRQFIRYDHKRQYGPRAVYCRRFKRAGTGNRSDQFRELEFGSNYGHKPSWWLRYQPVQIAQVGVVFPFKHDQCRAKFFGHECFDCWSFDDCVWFNGSRRHWCVAHLSRER